MLGDDTPLHSQGGVSFRDWEGVVIGEGINQVSALLVLFYISS